MKFLRIRICFISSAWIRDPIAYSQKFSDVQWERDADCHQRGKDFVPGLNAQSSIKFLAFCQQVGMQMFRPRPPANASGNYQR